jgi:hypothetical protein
MLVALASQCHWCFVMRNVWSISDAQYVLVLITYNNIEPAKLKEETLKSSCWDIEASIAGSKNCCQNKYEVVHLKHCNRSSKSDSAHTD